MPSSYKMMKCNDIWFELIYCTDIWTFLRKVIILMNMVLGSQHVTDKQMTSHHSRTIVEMWADPSSNKLGL